jgi:formate hydrogenlyase subunit 6/NADH:ubiquinone oxidoreductase subunit I
MCTQTCPFDATTMHTTTEEQRALKEFFQIKPEVFENKKFEKGFERGIKLSKVKG